MSESNLLDKLELRVFGQRRNGLGNSEHGADDVVGGVSQIPGRLSEQVVDVDGQRLAPLP